ncbi:ubiquinone biosynthesis protein COQ4 [Lachancea thermotolerans CBS 6340]|uniref:Ubiquinone biosynthesis protein COQ4, mitochondrial n=1 Tax=Lachancea thermotolerans (strain ATCC 56472 / CBS 6340 / NRRL Y-8284) TaxID=559295 RepID=COQ4_LACTC|nr:KLTH0F08184p [Lachancea thermotolerans CBS 6340]C5DKX0.1 RecName: Full=Ubiquinone biosynthesis protein COQ4, mitochondrial; AltName: Full=Coenzyme Q biosynthesis protein 4 [Lachancea thermotolerans CBS 6340]CAR24121.1 KLTH0F08184p [Lachancea thermotolerans CBS 6340]
MIRTSFKHSIETRNQLLHRRHFVVAAALTVGNFVFGRDARLADAMDNGELHNKNEDYKAKAEELKEQRLRSIANSRPMKPCYEGHVPLYPHERVLLFITSGLKSYFHPEDGENIVQLGEASAFTPFLERLKNTMLSDKTGRRILREQPDITSESLDMDRLKKMAPNTLGHSYYKWLIKEGVSPDTRAPVKYIDDPTHAYIFKRYRQCHDFYHAVNDLPIIIEGEIAVKALEAANIGVPMAALGALLAPLRLKPVQKKRLYDVYLPWAVRTGLSCEPLINVYWEELLEHDVEELRKKLRITPPPDLRAIRRERAQQRKQFKLKYERHE